MKTCYLAVLTVFLLALPLPAAALYILCSCSVAIDSDVAFGTYNPLPGNAADTAGHFTTTCDVTLGLLDTYSVALSTGGSGSYAPRQMSSGANRLNYNLFIDAAHTSVWGNGSGGTVTVSDSSLLGLLGHFVRQYSIYGRIQANQQSTRPGSYTDTITITVTFQ